MLYFNTTLRVYVYQPGENDGRSHLVYMESTDQGDSWTQHDILEQEIYPNNANDTRNQQ